MRTLRGLIGLTLLFCFFLPSAQAQVFAVHFKNAKAAKKYKAHLSEYRGEMVVIGEPKLGFVYKTKENQLSYVPNGSNEMFVVNPKAPEKFAYFVVDGEKVEASKKNKLVIQGHHIEKLSMLMRDQSLPGLSKEYNIRTLQIEEFIVDRDSHEKGTTGWQARHVRLVTSMERLRGWLESTGFPGAIKQLEKDLNKQNKIVRGESIRARGEKAMASVKPCVVPDKLVELSQEISGGRDKFGAYESQHLRIYYIDTITDEQAEAALAKGEEVIEGFRAEFVDPYLSEDYPDFIPDWLFQEFLFVPKDLNSFEKYTAGFYGIGWKGENREASLAMSGGNNIGGMPKRRFQSYWKTDDADLEGIICHRLGHSVATLHYGHGRMNLQQDWLGEALGYYISFEYLGRNNVTCKAFHKDKTGYLKRDKEEKDEGEKTVGEGRRDVYNQVALAEGRSIDQIALKILYELEDADMAKSWSFYDYIARKEGKPGQEWLRAAGKFATSRSTFINNWREAAATILGVSPGQAFRALEERWREYAESEQETD